MLDGHDLSGASLRMDDKAAALGVLIAPTGDAELWRALIQAAVVAESGRLLQLGELERPASFEPGAVYVASEPDALLGLRPENVAIVVSSVEDVDGEFTLPRASEWLAGACRALGGAISEEQILFASGQKTLRLLSRWDVTNPSLSPGLARQAGVRALEIYGSGLPAIGARSDWSPEIFSYDAKASASAGAPGELHIPGRARCLFHGPYFFLTAGRWRATVRFSVDEDAALRNLRLEWGGAHQFAELAFCPGKAGLYEAVLEHDWIVPEAGEIRLILTESALQGRISLFGVHVEMIAESAAEAASPAY